MRENQEEDRIVLKEMIIVLISYGALAEIIGILFFRSSILSYTIGLWTGIATAAGMAYNMWKTIRISLEDAAGNAEGYIRKKSIIRYLTVVLVLLANMMIPAGNPTLRGLVCFAGVMGLKVAAYLQPFAHKLLRR